MEKLQQFFSRSAGCFLFCNGFDYQGLNVRFWWSFVFYQILVACENSHLSLLFASRNVLPEGMSVSQLQRFHTDDIKMFICLESGQELWLVNIVVILIVLAMFTKDRQKTNDYTVTVMIKRGQKWKHKRKLLGLSKMKLAPQKSQPSKNFDKGYNFKKSRN